MDKRYQVFVSSTYDDLRDEREIVIQTLIRMNCIPAGMELFPAADEEQFEYIKKVIDDCDYYLLIIGGRYGSVTSNNLSYTEKEYNYAKKAGIKIVALIHSKPSEIPAGKSESDPQLRKKLEAFRAKVAKNRLVKFWTESNQLEGLVALNVNDAIRMYPAIGWVRANQVSNTELLTELNELRKNKDRLEAEIQTLKLNSEASIFTPHEESEFNYIFSKINILHKASLHVSIPKEFPSEKPEYVSEKFDVKYSLVKILYKNVQRNVIRYSARSFLDPLNTEPKLSKLETRLELTGIRLQRLNPDQFLQGNLTALGFISIETRISETQSAFGTPYYEVFNFSEKLYRFVSWLEYHNKIKNDSEIEFDDSLKLLFEGEAKG